MEENKFLLGVDCTVVIAVFAVDTVSDCMLADVTVVDSLAICNS